MPMGAIKLASPIYRQPAGYQRGSPPLVVALSQARGVRDQLLYLAEDSIVATAKLVKAYVKAAFGTSHQLYLQIKGIEFPKQRKRG